MKIQILENINDHKELLPQIVDRIFAVCRKDPNFHLKDEMEIVENRMESLRHKIEKQDSLLRQSTELMRDLSQRVSILDDQNEKKQIELLESLGSDL